MFHFRPFCAAKAKRQTGSRLRLAWRRTHRSPSVVTAPVQCCMHRREPQSGADCSAPAAPGHRDAAARQRVRGGGAGGRERVTVRMRLPRAAGARGGRGTKCEMTDRQ